jgi:hypothetical protein
MLRRGGRRWESLPGKPCATVRLCCRRVDVDPRQFLACLDWCCAVCEPPGFVISRSRVRAPRRAERRHPQRRRAWKVIADVVGYVTVATHGMPAAGGRSCRLLPVRRTRDLTRVGAWGAFRLLLPAGLSGWGGRTARAACGAMLLDAEAWTPVDAGCRLVPLWAGEESLNHRYWRVRRCESLTLHHLINLLLTSRIRSVVAYCGVTGRVGMNSWPARRVS